MLREITKIGLAVVQDGCLLLVRKRGSNCYILPGGKPEDGEDDVIALEREIGEELGCAVALRSLAYIGTFRDRAAGISDAEIVVKLYAGTLIGEPAPRSEIEHIIWFDPRSGRAVELAPSLTNSIVPHIFCLGATKRGSFQAHP